MSEIIKENEQNETVTLDKSEFEKFQDLFEQSIGKCTSYKKNVEELEIHNNELSNKVKDLEYKLKPIPLDLHSLQNKVNGKGESDQMFDLNIGIPNEE